MTRRPAIASIVAQIDEAFDRRSWHGTNLRGSLRGMTAASAAWRPGAGRHNAWEITLHAAYWKYAAWRRLTGEKRGAFARPGSNWFPTPAPASESAWRKDVALLQQYHRVLRAAVRQLSDEGDELRPGDVVYAVNGVSVLGLAELRSAVGRPAPGQPLVLHVERASRLIYVVVEVE